MLLAALIALAGSPSAAQSGAQWAQVQAQARAITAPAKAPPAALSKAQREMLDALFDALPAAQLSWPGFDFLAKPFLAVLEDGSAVLLAHPAPPAPFRAARWRNRDVFVAAAAVAAGRKDVQDLRDKRDAALKKFLAQSGLRVKLAAKPDGQTYFSGSWLTYPDGSLLFDPIEEYVGKGYALKGVMLRESPQGKEFFLAPGAVIEADGAVWTPVKGARAFARLTLSGTGVSLDRGPGRLEYDGAALTITLE